MNTPGRKNVCSKSTEETPEKIEICSNFKRTALEHIRISQLVPRVQLVTLKVYFQTGL